MVAQHWGTWLLSDEPFDEPPQELQRALAADASANSVGKTSVEDNWFITVRLGETNEQPVV